MLSVSMLSVSMLSVIILNVEMLIRSFVNTIPDKKDPLTMGLALYRDLQRVPDPREVGE
jgi:hypothetical protein